jgi:hypothetical protein
MDHNKTIIGLVGFAGSGKDTVADYLCTHYQFTRNSFAASVKDVLSNVFQWDRALLEGVTEESRQWRETINEWWATRLNIPNLTPRLMMQHIGTEIFRDQFHNEIWIASLERKLLDSSQNIVITDCRFENEINAIRTIGGKIVSILRYPYPSWYSPGYYNIDLLASSGVHPSEYSWINAKIDYTLHNSHSIAALHCDIDTLIECLAPNLLVAR